MVPCSVEFAHIYQNEPFSEVHRRGVSLLEQLRQFLPAGEMTAKVLIDDYHPVKDTPGWREDELLSRLEGLGVRPDALGYEAGFASVVEQIIEALPPEALRWESFDRGARQVLFAQGASGRLLALKNCRLVPTPSTDGHCIGRQPQVRYTCLSLSAAWHLCRLGLFDYPCGSIRALSEQPLVSEQTLTILPKSYQCVEGKAVELMQRVTEQDLTDRVQYHFF